MGPASKMDYFILNDTSISLASTCQYLRGMMISVLFYRLQFYLPSDPHAIDFELRVRECISWLKRRPDIRSHVQHFNLWSSTTLPMDDGSRHLFLRYALDRVTIWSALLITDVSFKKDFHDCSAHSYAFRFSSVMELSGGES